MTPIQLPIPPILAIHTPECANRGRGCGLWLFGCVITLALISTLTATLTATVTLALTLDLNLALTLAWATEHNAARDSALAGTKDRPWWKVRIRSRVKSQGQGLGTGTSANCRVQVRVRPVSMQQPDP